MYLFCTLMAVTVLIFPLDSSCAVDISTCFSRVGDISLDIFSWKLKSHVSQMMLFLIRESLLSLELHMDFRAVHCVTHVSKLPSSWFQVKPKYIPHLHPNPNTCPQYLSASNHVQLSIIPVFLSQSMGYKVEANLCLINPYGQFCILDPFFLCPVPVITQYSLSQDPVFLCSKSYCSSP